MKITIRRAPEQGGQLKRTHRELSTISCLCSKVQFTRAFNLLRGSFLNAVLLIAGCTFQYAGTVLGAIRVRAVSGYSRDWCHERHKEDMPIAILAWPMYKPVPRNYSESSARAGVARRERALLTTLSGVKTVIDASTPALRRLVAVFEVGKCAKETWGRSDQKSLFPRQRHMHRRYLQHDTHRH